MDRFAWTDGSLNGDEQLISQQTGVRIYDGEDKTNFENGKISLTTHRLIWRDYKDARYTISVPLSYVVYCEEQSGGFAKSAKIIVHLNATPAYKPPGPVTSSPNNYIRLSFRDGGQPEIFKHIQQALSSKGWEKQSPIHVPVSSVNASGQGSQFRSGIGGIEKKMQQRHKETGQSISKAFKDLSKLMDQAKEMVNLSKNISNKIKEKQGDITEDETVKFKSYLLSLGIQDPVTRETHGSGDKYYQELAKQLSDTLQKPLRECCGIMTLTDVYCRTNRMRGMELLSPEDLMNACKLMERMQLPIRMRIFDSGVTVLQLQTHSDEQVVKQTGEVVDDAGSITADELAKIIGLSVVLSKERLLCAEKAGALCRDETSEGLRFYPNKFLSQPTC